MLFTHPSIFSDCNYYGMASYYSMLAIEKGLIVSIFMIRIYILRVQFPIKLSFSVAINKAQGQTLQEAGVHFENPCFSHDKL